MDFLKDQVKFSDSPSEEPNHKPTKPEEPNHKPTNPDDMNHKPASSAEIARSAKVIADAAQAAARKDTASLDKAKVAGAAADLLDAAETYGKLDNKSGVGQYLDKAENYLHQYETKNHSAGTAGGGAPADSPAGEEAGKKGDGDSGSGLGGYMKMAQGFMK